jgi:hypothetical protein
MYLTIEDLQGNPASINTDSMIRLRPSYGQHEPSNTTFVDFSTGGVFSREELGALVDKFAEYLALAKLESPIGTPVFLSVDAVAAITAPDRFRHHENTRSVAKFKPAFINPLNPGRSEQQLRQDVAEASAILQGAQVNFLGA